MGEFEDFLKNLTGHMDDPDWLSKSAIQLATILYTQGKEMAAAKLQEFVVATTYMNRTDDSGKKMSVAESEKRSVVDTDNAYEQQKLSREAIMETINSIKKRLEVLSWERKN